MAEWDNDFWRASAESDKAAASHRVTWAEAIAKIAFYLAVVAVVYIGFRYG